MDRRKFIRYAGLSSLPVFCQGIPLFSKAGSPLNQALQHLFPVDDRKVLVIIQLFGGNDGLNTLIPLEQYDLYQKARKNLAIPRNKILSLTGESRWGFHPALTGFQELYGKGQMAMIHSVGYEKPDFSHFRSTDIWMSGSGADTHSVTGWAARYLDKQYPGFPENYPQLQYPDPPAIQTGMAASLIFQGTRSPMSVNISDPGNVFKLQQGFDDALTDFTSGHELGFVRQVASQTQRYSDVIKSAWAKINSQSPYPAGNTLAEQLKLVARLIAGGLRTPVYMVSMEGFDTHAEQVDRERPFAGQHAELLQILGDAVKAFQDDLSFLGIADRVTGMTFSEFGRRIVSNESAGTDHGAAAPLFVFGAKVNGGIYGTAPVLPENATTADNLPMHTDYRSVYTSFLHDWFKTDPSAVKEILGATYPTLPLIGS